MAANTPVNVLERRQAIWNTLQVRRFDTAGNLAAEFHVSIRTMQNDLQEIMLTHPLKSVRGRYGGGYTLEEWYSPNQRSLSPKQLLLLNELAQHLSSENRRVLLSIINQFGP